MSLLMEALRKAEEAKRNIQTKSADAAPDAVLNSHISQADTAGDAVRTAALNSELDFDEEISPAVTADYIVDNFLRTETASDQPASDDPVPVPVVRSPIGKPTRASVEELLNYLEAAPELEETAPIPPPPEPPVKVAEKLQQQAASTVFAAKQKPPRKHKNRNILLAVLVLLIPFGGGIIWYLMNASNSSLLVDPGLLDANIANRSFPEEQLNDVPAIQPPEQDASPGTEITPSDPSSNQNSNQNSNQSTDLSSDQSPTATPADNSTVATTPGTGAAATGVPAIGLPTGNTAFSNAPALAPSPQTPPAPDIAAVQAIPVSAAETSPAEPITTNTAATSVTVLEVSHSAGTSQNNQQLVNAYASLQAGDFGAASALYQDVLVQLPNNRDALLGSAAIEFRNGNVASAREHYSRLMQLNPQDPLARTGLLQTIQDIDPQQYEQELRRLLQQFPDVAPLSFALGNLYAAQQRWNEAQGAYFNALLFAHQSDEPSVNPDYAYNLAVSLEQLDQPITALEYYRQAQVLADVFTPGFDMEALNRRIAFLEQSRP